MKLPDCHNLCRLITLNTIAFIIGVFCAACSSSLPGESEAAKSLEMISQQRGDLFKIKTVRKTDGVESVFNGVKQYKLTYQAEVECLKPTGEITGTEMIALGPPPVNCVQAGDVKKVQGTASFVKSEKGWQQVLWPASVMRAWEIQ